LLARLREAAFSSTGFRIPAAQGHAAGSRRWAEHAAASLFFTFFPADCRICNAPLIEISRLPVCQACLDALRPLAGMLCSVCGEALLSPAFMDRAEPQCGLCQRLHPPFERAVAYGSYDGGLRDLIHLLKYQQVRPVVAVLGRMLAEAIASLETTLPAGAIAVIPVPLHERKRAQRGFNQSELIARAALKQLRRPERFQLLTGGLIRRRETESQIGLTRHQRRENLRGAFAVVDPGQIVKRNVLLVDDVFTTGTTASECARVLRRAGANRVYVATVARTLKVSEIFAVPEQEFEETNDNRLAAAANG
jgi:ComF family protein